RAGPAAGPQRPGQQMAPPPGAGRSLLLQDSLEPREVPAPGRSEDHEGGERQPAGEQRDGGEAQPRHRASVPRRRWRPAAGRGAYSTRTRSARVASAVPGWEKRPTAEIAYSPGVLIG